MDKAQSPIEAWRNHLGLSKYRIELDTKLARTTIYSALRTGEANYPTLRAIADCFDIEVWELLKGPPGYRETLGEDDLDSGNRDGSVDSEQSQWQKIAARLAAAAGTAKRSEIAARADVSESMLSLYLSGKRRPRPEVFRELIRAVGVSADVILGLDDMLPTEDHAKVAIVAKKHLTRGVVGPQQDSLTLPLMFLKHVDPDAELLGVADRGVILIVDHRRMKLKAGMELLIRVGDQLDTSVVRIGAGGLMIAPRGSAAIYDPADDRVEILGRILIRLEDVVVNALHPSTL